MIKNLIKMFKETWIHLLAALAVTLILRWQFGPQFIDIFGIFVFGGITFLGLWLLYTKNKINQWISFSLLVVGIGGIILDGISSFQLIKSWILRGLI